MNALKRAKDRRDIALVMFDEAEKMEKSSEVIAQSDESQKTAKATALDSLKARHASDISVGADAVSKAEHDIALRYAVESKSLILRASIELDFAATKAMRSQKAHAAAVETLGVAKRELRAAAIAFADAGDAELAERREALLQESDRLFHQINSRVPSALSLAGNQAARQVPFVVAKTLERKPTDPMNTPISQMHDGCSYAAWNARISKIMAGEQAT